MAAPTDLTWQQINDAFGQPLVTQVLIGESGTALVINLATLSPENLTTNQPGVIKALAKLLELARKAQETLNEGKPVGEKLAAFPAPVIGGQSNGFVPVNRTIASRADLNSVTSIVGATA